MNAPINPVSSPIIEKVTHHGLKAVALKLMLWPRIPQV